jgi:hypothetical protein
VQKFCLATLGWYIDLRYDLRYASGGVQRSNKGANMSDNKEKAQWARISELHARVSRLADEEARAAWVNGAAADGRFLDIKADLISQAEKILAELEKGWRDH